MQKCSIMVLAILALVALGARAQSVRNEKIQNVATLNTTDGPDLELEGRRLMEPLALPYPVRTQNVAFSVRKAIGRLSAVTRLHFRDVLTNIGDGWNPASSEFVAPHNGGYHFVFHAIGARTSDFTLALMKNGVYVVTAYGKLITYEHGSNSVFLELRSFDRIALELQEGAIYEHPGNEAYTTFTGFYLFST
ncbi:cerebellin-2 [Procambarus clarkii]|uniref:cerebellin-2 n=1 Tax=Procambarus clarkii TaxID=6728 RepID=UPI0037429E9B